MSHIHERRRRMEERADRVASFSHSIDAIARIMGGMNGDGDIAKLRVAVSVSQERRAAVPGLSDGPHVAPLAEAERLLANAG